MAPGAYAHSRLSLPSERRLRRKADFEAAYARGKRIGSEFFLVIARPSSTGPRIGLAISSKVAGNSVQRNRIRRLIRESFRVRQHELPPCDLVVSARKVRGVPSSELRASLDGLWAKVREQCASFSPRASGSTSGS